MMDENAFDDLQNDAEGLNDTLGQTSALVTGFDGELKQMKSSLESTSKGLGAVEQGLSRGLRRAFDGLVFDGLNLSDALDAVARSLANTAYNAAIRPFANEAGKPVWFAYPRWTRDQSAIVYQAGGKLFLYTLADGSTRKVSTDDKADYRYPHGEATPK